MIIQSVRATNVLKYAELALDNLPASGLVAISGPNESGKSTIGETVCFALFGRTFSIGPDELEKVVRWGENQCSVTLSFEVEGKGYELSRFLDHDGNHSARLLRQGEQEPLARGVEAVADALFGILGYEFDEFIESFYLAQREITTPHPHSHAVKIMAGVAPLEHVADQFAQEIGDQQEKLAEIETELDAARQELAELDVEEGYLVRIEDERTALDHRLADNRRLLDELETSLAGYVERLPGIQAARGARGTAGFFGGLFLLLGLAAGAVWGLLTRGADLPIAAQLHETLQGLPNWQDAYIPYVGYAAIALGVLSLLFWIRTASQGGAARTLAGEAAALAEPLARVREVAEEPPRYVEPVSEAAPEEDEAAEQPAAGIEERKSIERPSQARFEEIHPRIQAAEAGMREVSDYAGQEQDWLQALTVQQALHLADLDREIEDESARVQQAAKLHEVIDSLSDKQRGMLHRIELREQATELLAGASQHLSNHFNRDVRDLVGQTLPLFTENRYEHLKIDEDLGVRVFSSDKRDFMDLDEVSSGTQRQIMLALRLALSQKLLSRAVRGRQFAFLDEPFAFFDDARTRSALEALSAIDSDISQIWIVAQSFPEGADVSFAARIECARDRDALQLNT
jgi:exonuclease SbcC